MCHIETLDKDPHHTSIVVDLDKLVPDKLTERTRGPMSDRSDGVKEKGTTRGVGAPEKGETKDKLEHKERHNTGKNAQNNPRRLTPTENIPIRKK